MIRCRNLGSFGRHETVIASLLALQSVLKDVVSRPESFSGEVLLRTRRRLGVSEVVAGGMHLDVYQSAIQASI